MNNYPATKFQSFLRWLGAKLFPQEAAAQPDFQQTGVRVRPPHARPGETRAMETLTPDTRPDMVRFRAELGGQIADGGPGKNVLVRSKFVREESGTHDNLKILDGALFEEEEEGGIDPYNTGRFDRAKSWEFRSRK